MQKRLAWVVFFSSLLAMFWTVGCSDDADNSSSSSGNGGSGGGTGSGANGSGGDCILGCGGNGTGGGAQGVIIVEPANAVITVVDATIPTQAYTATLNGQDVTANVTWIYERPDVGDMNGDIFEPTGLVGGVANLTAQWNNASGSTTVTVTIEKTLNSGGLTQQQIDAFNNPSGPDPSMALVYPYDATVFPLGVLAPEMQWNGSASGDLYKLTMTEQFYSYTEYFSNSPPSRHLVSETDWTNLGASGNGAQSDPLSVSIQRQSGGVAYEPLDQTWHIAQGRLKGSVYYWELPGVCGGAADGRILRIKPDSPVVDQFFNPGECWGCHTVSRDGQTMAATFETTFPFPFQTIDLTQDPAVLGAMTNAAGVVGTFAAFNDIGDKLLVSNDGTAANELNIHDSTTGAVLAPNVFQGACGEPAWSPDGTKLAGICGVSGGGWIFDSGAGDLQVADVAADGVTVSNIQTIVTAAGGTGRPAYPSFSPGSEWLAFGRPTSGSRSTGNGDLWLVAPDGSDLKQLAIASSDNRSFNPVFAPLRAGGYFWLVFITRRDYGNRLVGANRQQLWITAITDPPTAADPSNPPFYLRGQEECGKSENAYYALDPCKEIGEDCTSGIDCCNGTCIKDPNTGNYVCGEPPDPGECVQDGNACDTTADCCNAPSSTCVDGFCQPDIPK